MDLQNDDSCTVSGEGMAAQISYLFSRSALSSFHKQIYLNELVGAFRWHFDVATGIVSFGKDLYWHAQILGTESYETNTWLWAWANTGSNLPPALIQASLQMKQLGKQKKIRELTEPQISLTE